MRDSIRLGTPPEGHTMVDCRYCNASGHVVELGESVECDNCDGKGEVIHAKCDCGDCQDERDHDDELANERDLYRYYARGGQ